MSQQDEDSKRNPVERDQLATTRDSETSLVYYQSPVAVCLRARLFVPIGDGREKEKKKRRKTSLQIDLYVTWRASEQKGQLLI